MAGVKMRDAYQVIDEICGDLPYTFEDKYYDALNNISVALVDYRIAHHLSQKQLADKLGMSQAMISKYESGDNNFSLKTLFELLGKLKIDFDLHIGKESDAGESPTSISDTYSSADESILFGAA